MQPDWQQYINQKYGKNYVWQSFAKGSSNTLFRGEDGHHELVVRINAPSQLTPSVNRNREATLLTIIAKYPWSPHVIENQLEQGWCAMQCYQPFTEEALSEQQKSQIITAIRELQLIDTPLASEQQNLVIQYETLWNTLYLPEAKKRNHQQALLWIATIKQLLKELPTVKTCFVHHDLHLGNLAIDQTQSPERIILLDWEYGGIGNPWIDAATLKSLLAIEDQDIAQLPAFKHLTPDSFANGLLQAVELIDTISNIWYWLRDPDSM